MIVRAATSGMVVGAMGFLVFAFLAWDIPTADTRQMIVWIALAAAVVEALFGSDR